MQKRERRRCQYEGNKEEVLGKRQRYQLPQRQVAPDERKVAPSTLDCEKHAPWDQTQVNLLSPPEPAGFFGCDLDGIEVDRGVAEPSREEDVGRILAKRKDPLVSIKSTVLLIRWRFLLKLSNCTVDAPCGCADVALACPYPVGQRRIVQGAIDGAGKADRGQACEDGQQGRSASQALAGILGWPESATRSVEASTNLERQPDRCEKVAGDKRNGIVSAIARSH